MSISGKSLNHPGVLTIGKEVTVHVTDLRDASNAYQVARDRTGLGCSKFPQGTLVLAGKRYRISFNGRVWDGDRVVQEAT